MSMETKIVNGLLIIKLNMIQAIALAVITYYFGEFIRNKFPLMRRLSVPSPVIGGLIFASISSVLRMQGILLI